MDRFKSFGEKEIHGSIVLVRLEMIACGGISSGGSLQVTRGDLMGSIETNAWVEQERICLGLECRTLADRFEGVEVDFFLSRNLVILITLRRILAGLCLHMTKQRNYCQAGDPDLALARD